MKTKGKPKVTKRPVNHLPKYLIADFKRFGLESYSERMYQLMERRVFDIAGVTDKKIQVYYNKRVIKQKTFDKYIRLYLKDETSCMKTFMNVGHLV